MARNIPLKRYSVYRRKDDKPIAIFATRRECAAALGIDLNTFACYITRQRAGRSYALATDAPTAERRMIMVCSFTPTQKERLERYGYRFVHLFGNVYLVRNYSVNAKEFSLYGVAVLRKGE